jgi:hypothetical protein
MDERAQSELEAAVFRRLVAHLRQRTDVQNIDMMITAGFCRNCLGDWYREAAAETGIEVSKDAARARLWHAASRMGAALPERRDAGAASRIRAIAKDPQLIAKRCVAPASATLIWSWPARPGP